MRLMYYVTGGGLQKENRKSRGKMKIIVYVIVIDLKNNIPYS